MELSDLQTFAAVARCGGITRAAGELNTVQSNVTNRVRALEMEVGVPLFERHARGMTLTDAGRRLLPYAQRLSVLSREALSAARDDGVPKGPLAIGSMETTAAVRLPSYRFPDVQLTLQTRPTAMLTEVTELSLLGQSIIPISSRRRSSMRSLCFCLRVGGRPLRPCGPERRHRGRPSSYFELAALIDSDSSSS